MRKKRDLFFWSGVVFLVLLVLFAIFGPTMRWDYLKPVAKPHLPASGEFWFGTDEIGRDVFARVAYGARMSLLVGLTVQAIALGIGITVGILGVYAHRWVRTPVMRFTDGMFAFPDILLAILIVGVWQPEQPELKLVPLVVALAVTAWPAMARLVATQTATLKDREFVVAAKALGGSPFYVVTRHVLPQLWGIVLAVGMVELAGTILAESTLSFLGIGVQPPNPSWGSMINSARQDLNSHPILIVWPCVFLIATIFALNFVGDGLRAILDPKQK